MLRKTIRIISLLTICVMIITLVPANTYASKKSGTYPTKPGRILATSDFYKGLIPTGHAAIVLDKNNVVEARAKGVILGKNNWTKQKKQFWGLEVLTKKKGPVLSDAKHKKAANWCKNRIGKPYNYNYLNTSTRNSFYCSQLVWAAYKDKYGIDLNTSLFAGYYTVGYIGRLPIKTYANPIHPLELVSSKKTKQVYYYKK